MKTNVSQVLESLALNAQFGAKELNLTITFHNHCTCKHVYDDTDSHESLVDMYATEEELTQALSQIGNVEFVDVDDRDVFAHITVERSVELMCPHCEEEMYLEIEYASEQQ